MCDKAYIETIQPSFSPVQIKKGQALIFVCGNIHYAGIAASDSKDGYVRVKKVINPKTQEPYPWTRDYFDIQSNSKVIKAINGYEIDY